MKQIVETKPTKDGNPQVEDGYMRIANELWDAWMCCRFTEREDRIIKTIVRFSYGVGKKYALLSKSEIARYAYIELPHVGELLSSLVSKKVVEMGNTSISGVLKIRINKHYLDWQVDRAFEKGGDFKEQFNRTLTRNLASSEITENVTEVTEKVTEADQEVTENVTPGYGKGNQEVTENVSGGYVKRNLSGIEETEIINEKPALKTVKDIIKDSLKTSSSACIEDPPPGADSPLSDLFLEVVKSYPEFDVRDDDAGWFEERVGRNSLYRDLELEHELHNWDDWLETEHRKKETKRGNKFPRSNFKASLTNWLKKALEMRAWKGERHERDQYSQERDGTRRRGGRGDDGGEIPPFSDIPPELLP
jgi:phage replication O-like protein O